MECVGVTEFRESGELSDVTVCVGGREFHLHQFPLYTRSQYFRVLAKTESGKVVLDQFPGGAQTFEMVANFCYGQPIDVTSLNVCQLRCAAEFLQMTSPGNLADVIDRHLSNILTSAKLGRDLGTVVDLLLSCRNLGDIVQEAGIVDKCLDAMVDCWLLSSKWSRRSERVLLDSRVLRLSHLPLKWFLKLYTTCKEKHVRGPLLAKVVEMYVVDHIRRNGNEEKTDDTTDGRDLLPEEELQKSINDNMEIDKKGKMNENGSNVDNSESGSVVEEETKPTDVIEDTVDARSDSTTSNKQRSDATESDDKVDDATLVTVMGTLLLGLPDDLPRDAFSPRCVAVMLRTADRLGCTCREWLVKVACRLLGSFTPQDLAPMTPQLVLHLVAEANSDPDKVSGSTVCTVLDAYMLQLAIGSELTAGLFTQLVEAVPAEHRVSHDHLFLALEKLLQSDTKLTDEERSAMLESVDFRRLSGPILQQAYDSKSIPETYITKAALALCVRLRSELETAREIIRSQGEEMSRYGLGSRGSSWLREMETEFGLHTIPQADNCDETYPDDQEQEDETLEEKEEDEYYECPSYSPGGDRFTATVRRHLSAADTQPIYPRATYTERSSYTPVDQYNAVDSYHSTYDERYFPRYSSYGNDPILEKALGGRYYDDPFDPDSEYPWYHYTRRCYHDNHYTCSIHWPRRYSSYYNSSRTSLPHFSSW